MNWNIVHFSDASVRVRQECEREVKFTLEFPVLFYRVFTDPYNFYGGSSDLNRSYCCLNVRQPLLHVGDPAFA